jgi:hypothetical protein
VKLPSAKNAALALHLVAEAQKLLERVDLQLPAKMVPQLLRDLADKLEAEADASRDSQE